MNFTPESNEAPPIPRPAVMHQVTLTRRHAARQDMAGRVLAGAA